MAERENPETPETEDPNTPPEDRLRKVLEARWDPSKLSSLVKAQEASRGQKLDFSQRSRFEGRFGVDLSNVRIFSGELAEDITRAHGAEALTIGDTGMILMRGSTQYSSLSNAGKALLAHELTHVAQARPAAVARKGVEMDLAQEDESEEEAEAEEAKEALEQAGLAAPEEPSAADGQKDRERKERIVKRVLELYADEAYIAAMRTGFGYDPKL